MDWRVYRKNAPRVSVSVDILVLILISISFFDLKPFQPIMGGNGTYTFYMLALAVIYIRNQGLQIRYGIFPKLKPFWWMFAGILISFIPAYLYYGQHLYHSVVVYRQIAGYLVYPVLLSIQPTKVELKRALYVFSFLYLIAVIWTTLFHPEWAIVYENDDFMGDSDLVHRLSGDQFLVPALIFALDDFRYKKNKFRYAFMALVIFLDIFLIQSRTILIASVAIVVMAAILDKKASRRLAAEVIMIFFLVAFFILTYRFILGLFNETVDQLTNPDYNRVKAFNYFISGVNGWPSYLWGNGFISANAHPIMEILKSEGIYHSDLGLIGMWHQFGIIPVLTILVYVFRGLSKYHSFIVRANAMNILVCSLTISYFFNVRYSLWLWLFFYLFYTDTEYVTAKKKLEEKRMKQATQKYRSLV